MKKFNGSPAFLGLTMSILFSFNAYAGVEGWKLENNNWKYYKENKTLKAWQQINNNWYFFNEDGSLKTGWLQDASNNWYFLDSSKNGNEGVLLSGWQWIDGYCYYFEGNNKDSFGRMYSNTVVEGYKLDSTGRWTNENGTQHYEGGKGISTSAVNITNAAKKASDGGTGSSVGRGGSSGGGSGRGGNSGSGSSRSGSFGSGSNRSGSSGSGSSRSGNLGADLSREENSNIENIHEINKYKRIESQSVNTAQNSGSNITESLNGNIRTENSRTTDNKISDSTKQLPNNSQKRFDNAVNKNLNGEDNTSNKSLPREIGNNTSDDKEVNNSNNAHNQNGNVLNQNSTESNNTGNNSEHSNVGNAPNQSNKESNNIGNNSNQNNAGEKNPGANNEGNTPPSTEENNNTVQPPASDNTENPTQPDKQEQPNENEESAEDKAERIKDSLITPENDNVVQYTNEDGEIRTIIWAKGINGPVMGEGGDFHKEITQGGSDTYVSYKASFSSGDGWYDVNKTRSGGNIDIDKNLCFAAVASNMLHWWFDQNIENVDNYIAKNGDITHANRQLSDLKTSFESQEESKIFELYKVLYGYNERGFYTDLLVDLFINGYTPKLSGATNIERDDLVPDNNGGFFYDVFKEKKLTDRTYGGRYESLSENLKLELGRGGLVGLSHKVFSRNNHIVTLWGAEYDLNGKLSAVYVSDSDDQDESNVGMKRYEVRNVDGIAKVSTNITDKSAGAVVGYLHILYLGTNQWNDYFR
ncbi:IdeS/Mac family cysteine endopeptidase [Lachnoanaerobaculum gingivalis]|uniref:IdeS/Mac family cysteine endopeptidase n=1 Tax=Lachnoanaerobaculum gingivalis TaxID=2490855 RepID=UPI0024A765D4|nr:IdeS/Mac family cysteine endopeptidase [Lachnoanaerobaculum gingivalis]WHE87571.1 IdeS/Mac family cysteine endopeptidase [Lachnoanaerobaculum gingivalis]